MVAGSFSNISGGKYRNLYVVIEHVDGKLVPVSLEMLGEARRLMDNFNERYQESERVIAVVLGYNVRDLCLQLISHGADVVVYAEDKELEYSRNTVETKVIAQISRDTGLARQISPQYIPPYIKPRYMFFAADSIGRHLSSTVLAELESGLASDINKLVISDIDIRHEHKTKGQTVKYERTLEMYRPDFSGFLWTTILCLDNKNPEIMRDYHPQGCSIIPGVFKAIEPDIAREGVILEYKPKIDPEDLKVKVLNRELLKKKIDFDSHSSIVSMGRGIKADPEQNIKIIEQFARLLDAEVGISLPLSKRLYQINDSINFKYMIPERVIGTSGSKVAPSFYIALGISGAVQHIAGMKESGFVMAINPDENAPIKDESDIFIKGRMEDVLPIIIEELQKLTAIISSTLE
ncbi:MAG: electron transfer flavoprotein subunit alpha/FixB family protein [Thermoproteota archaeon]|nr:electron transfer flavoprotein subunit alpha/FixB family protein [Thermoproteota archaeon]